MELARSGDHNSGDFGVGNGFVEVGVNLGAGTGNLCALLRALGEHVAHSHDLRATDTVLDALDMLFADHAAADYTDVKFLHDIFLHPK